MTPPTPVVLGIPVDARENELDIFIDEYVRYPQYAPRTFYQARLTCCGSTLDTICPGAESAPAITLNELLEELAELGIEVEHVIKTTRSGSGFCG